MELVGFATAAAGLGYVLGAAVGDEVEYEAPTGAVLKIKVLAIA